MLGEKSIILFQSSDSSTCQVAELQGSAKEAALHQALADPQVQWLISQLEGRRYHLSLEAAQAFQVGEASLQVVIPLRTDGRLVWGRRESGETLAKAVISRKQQWEILEPYDHWQRFRSVATTELKETLKDLHKNEEFQKVKKDLEDKGYKLVEEKTRGILNETKGEFFFWLRWQKQEIGDSASRAIPLAYDDGYRTGGGGTDIAVIWVYDPTTGTWKLKLLWPVPPDLVAFVECLADHGIDYFALAKALEFCLEFCIACRYVWGPLLPGCLAGCALCIATAVGIGLYGVIVCQGG